jgi:hypothetical protein
MHVHALTVGLDLKSTLWEIQAENMTFKNHDNGTLSSLFLTNTERKKNTLLSEYSRSSKPTKGLVLVGANQASFSE